MSSSYSELLRHPKWQRKRLEVMNAAGFRCEKCGDAETTLNVHHKKYRCGAKPWEYELHELECLCERCHQKEHGIKFETVDPLSYEQFSHHCPFHGGRSIDEHMDEFRLCRCFAPTKQVLRLQDNINVRLDYVRHE